MRVVLVLFCLVAAASAASRLRAAFQRGQAAAESEDSLLMPRFREVLALKPNWNLIRGFTSAYAFAKGKVDSSKTAQEDEPKSADDLDKFLNTQVTRDKRKATFEEFLKMYKTVADADAPNSALWDTALKEMLDLLFSASINDPTYYVSHAADHGVRVDILWENYLRNIKGITKLLRKQLLGLDPSRSVADSEKVEITRSVAPNKIKVPVDQYCRVIAGIAHILHDVGYSGLPYGISPKLKWTHAINGAELISRKLKDSLGKVIPEAHFKLIVEAIRDHNADSEGCKDKGCPYNGKAFNTADAHNPDKGLFPPGGVGIVSKDQVPTLMVRKYRAASLDPAAPTFDPLLFLLRFADNGDAARLRLTEGQRNPDVMRCWRDLAVGCDISKKRDDIKKGNPDADLSDEDVVAIKNTLPSCQKVKTENPTYYDELIMPAAINHFSFLHYYSNYVVKRMFWDDMGSPSSGSSDLPDATSFKRTLVVEFFAAPELEEDLAVASFPGPAAYQIIRFAEAAESLLLAGGARITDQVTIKMLSFPKKGETRTIPLAAFNPKTAIKDAGMCKQYNDNFAAKQKCFGKDGKITGTDILPLDKGFTPITCPGATLQSQQAAKKKK